MKGTLPLQAQVNLHLKVFHIPALLKFCQNSGFSNMNFVKSSGFFVCNNLHSTGNTEEGNGFTCISNSHSVHNAQKILYIIYTINNKYMYNVHYQSNELLI